MDNLNVIIVCYESYDLLVNCVASLRKHNIIQDENIVIVDNNSPDKSGLKIQNEFSQCKVVLSNSNGGFSSGVNLGMAASDKDYALILNPDTYFLENNIADALCEFENDTKIGLVGLNLLNPDCTLQYSARRFYSFLDIFVRRTPLGKVHLFSKRNSDHLMTAKYSEPMMDADWVMGTGFIVRRDIFEQIGRMDEEYFLYMEDVDLCTRMWLNGWKVKCKTGVRLVHHHQRQSKAGILSKAGMRHLRSLFLYRKKFSVPFFKPPTVDYIRRKCTHPHSFIVHDQLMD